MNPAAEYLKWKRKELDMGCLFARKIAFRPAGHGQIVEVVGASASAAHIAKSIDQRLSRLIGDPDAQAATLILPTVTTLPELAKVAMDLQGRPGWSVTAWPINECPAGEVVAVAVTREIPRDDGALVPSEALIFGPFGEFPPTRKAPVTALEIFTGKPFQTDPTKGHPVKRANLAHMELHVPGKTFEKMREGSVAGRLKSLNGIDDHRAKAKVSFVVTPAIAKDVGLLP